MMIAASGRVAPGWWLLALALLAGCVDPKTGGGKQDGSTKPGEDGGSGGSGGTGGRTGTGGGVPGGSGGSGGVNGGGTEGGVPGDGPCGALDDPHNCGTCGHDCSRLANVRVGASVQCQPGKCVVAAAACADG